MVKRGANPRNDKYLIGVDVGTGSVRTGIFNVHGKLFARAVQEIGIWQPEEHFVEQSSEDIWSAVSKTIRGIIKETAINPKLVAGIAFDATCSLVALIGQDRPITISPTGNPQRNVIVWMDHRAIRQAERINATKHPVLKYVGGKISPEMELPKLLWLKENIPMTWKHAARFLDLADYLSYRSTGVDVRSLCTTVCKWTYLGKEDKWDSSIFKKLGLEELLTENKIGGKILPVGQHIGTLTDKAAADFGLSTQTKVAVGIIDAHAGGLGVMGMGFQNIPEPNKFESILALIGGTSSCHMAVSRNPKFIPGIWGPYYSAMIPGMWLTEGGQTATGSLIDFIIRNSGQFERVSREAQATRITIYAYLNNIISKLKKRGHVGPELVKGINILPYFLGNRSPHADPALRGMISGLTLDESVESLAKLYYATIQSIAYGTRQIIEVMNDHGYDIRRIHACGGGTKNPLWLQEHADITGCEIVLPKEPEAVMLGSAMLAAVGACVYKTVPEAVIMMSAVGERYKPIKKFAGYHKAKYDVFRMMYKDFIKYEDLLEKF
ncbi:MAG: FGGY-family carbohydrate kinase [Bacteroidota bacterium]